MIGLADAMRIILAANPHRVFVSRIGRAEVFQPIPPPDGKRGPLRASLPPHPLRNQLGRRRPFRHDCHVAFQALLERYGNQDLVALLALPNGRFARATLRVTLRQLQASGQTLASLAPWLSACDGLGPADADDPMEALH
jgi:hypothetical protein